MFRTGLFASLLAALLVGTPAQGADPLPSWRGGAGKQRIMDFVTSVATPGSPAYLPPAERIAVFDDDGTLWPEKPRPQGMFALQRLREVAPQHRDWQYRLPFKAALELGAKYMQEASEEDVLQLVTAAYAGATEDGFQQAAAAYFAGTAQPRWDLPYRSLAYAPMRELLAYLRANGFQVFVVSGGSADVARVLAGDLYGIQPDDVIGNAAATTPREEDGRLVLRRMAAPDATVSRSGKPAAIQQHVGRRPILAVGNVGSGDDVDLLRYSEGAPGSTRPTLQLLIRHDDFDREFAYDEADRASLNAASTRGWLVVSMRYEWRRIFAHQDLAEPAPPVAAP